MAGVPCIYFCGNGSSTPAMKRPIIGGMQLPFVNDVRMDKVKDSVGTLSNAVADKGIVVIFVILTLMLIVVIIAFIIWRLNRSKLRGISLLKAPVNLARPGKADPIPANRLPAMHVGQDFSFSFWLYLSDFVATGKQKVIFLRRPSNSSNGTGEFTSTNPIVMLGSDTNKLYVCLRTNRTPTNPHASLSDILKAKDTNRTFLVSAIDYVPLQRWVNIAFAVEDNLLSLYMDGNVYTVQSLYDLNRKDNNSSSVVAPLFASCTGDIRLGNFKSDISDAVNGYISNLMFFNYALSSAQVSAVSVKGPDTGFSLIRSLGVPDYGIRSPIYRLDGQDDEDN